MKATDRDTEPKDFTNLYVKNMPRSWDDAKIKEMFAEYGTVTSTLVQKDPKGRSFAFVNYEEAESAKKAIEALEGKDFRTDEDKKADEEAEMEEEKKKEEEKKDDDKKEDEEKEKKEKDYGLFVGRAMSKSERARKLAEQFGTPVKGKGKGKGGKGGKGKGKGGKG